MTQSRLQALRAARDAIDREIRILVAENSAKPPPAVIGDELVPDSKVAYELGVTPMTMWRWSKDERLGFPPKIRIRTRNFRSRLALDSWIERQRTEPSTPAAQPPDQKRQVDG